MSQYYLAFRYNGLIAIMNKTMKDLQLALRGRIVMTEELEKVSAALFDNQVLRWRSTRVNARASPASATNFAHHMLPTRIFGCCGRKLYVPLFILSPVITV